MNKRGGFTDLFIFLIVAFILILFSGVFIYISQTTYNELEENIENLGLVGDGNNNASVVLQNTMGVANQSFKALYWIASFLIFGMILSIFIGSYMVTTKPIFFIPYIFISIIAVVLSAVMSNAYETLYLNATLNSTFQGFIGANWIMAKLPIVTTIVAFVGGIIMYSQMGKGNEGVYYGY